MNNRIQELLGEIKAISDAQLGDDYLTQSYLTQLLGESSTSFIVVATLTNDDQSYYVLPDEQPPKDEEVAGFCIGRIYTQESLQSYLNLPKMAYPDDIRGVEPIGIPRTIAVAEQHQRSGIGVGLTQRCLEWLESQDCEVTCVVAWDSEDGIRGQSILEELGFEVAKCVDRYWFEESLEEGYACGTCGEPPCTCRAVIFTKNSKRQVA